MRDGFVKVVLTSNLVAHVVWGVTRDVLRGSLQVTNVELLTVVEKLVKDTVDLSSRNVVFFGEHLLYLLDALTYRDEWSVDALCLAQSPL